MDFEKKVDLWQNEGGDPGELKEKGFTGGYHPPAGVFNWLFNKITACINEIQAKLSNQPADELKVKSLIGGTRIANSSDLNTYKIIGNYHCISDADAQSLTNCPIDSAFNMVIGHPTGQTAYLYQEIIDYVRGTRYYRECLASSLAWGNWVMTFDTTNLTPTAIGAANTAFSNIPDIATALYNLKVASVFKGTVDGTQYTFNTALTQAEYSVAGTDIEGAPFTGTIYGKLISIVNSGTTHNNDSNWIWQVFYATNFGRIYLRNKVNNGDWSSWAAVYNENNKPALSDLLGILPVTKGGTGASSVNGAVANLLCKTLVANESIVNANTLRHTGIHKVYLTDAALAANNNYPYVYGNLFVVSNMESTDYTYIMQLFLTTNGEIFCRASTNNGSTWTDWRKSVTDDKATNIATGSYNGISTGGSYSYSLSFDFKPKLILVQTHGYNEYATFVYGTPTTNVFLAGLGAEGLAVGAATEELRLTWKDNSIEWYCPGVFLGQSNLTYHYVAIG